MLVRIPSTYYTHELFVENMRLTSVRSQGLFRRLLPLLSTGSRNVIRVLPLSNIMYGYMSEYTSCGALGIILGIYLLIVVTSVINRVSYFAILPCPYEAGQESQAQAA